MTIAFTMYLQMTVVSCKRNMANYSNALANVFCYIQFYLTSNSKIFVIGLGVHKVDFKAVEQ